MTKWVLRCVECNVEWRLEVSFDLSEFPRLYHYCRNCRRSTFHQILGREDEV